MSNILEDTKVHDGTVETLSAFPNFKNITDTTTSSALVKSGAGTLHAIVVNTTAAGTVTVYDNTSGTGTTVGQLKASVAEGTYIYDCDFSTGLYVLPAAVGDYTVVYR